MSVTFCHETAMHILFQNRELSEAPRLLLPPFSKSGSDGFEIERQIALGRGLTHVMIPENQSRPRGSDYIQFHHSPCLNSLMEFIRCGNTYVASPELCFLEMATKLDMIDLILLGYKMCGDYRPANTRLLEGNKPITTKEKLEVFLESCPPTTQGLIKSKKALKYVLNNSCSHQESRTGLICILPYRLGGYCLPEMLLNVDIPHTTRTADLCWLQERLIVEYDSDEYHRFRGTRDSARSVELELEGFEVISITTEQAQDIYQLDAAAQLIAKKLGRRVCKGEYFNKRSPKYKDEHSKLHKRLFLKSCSADEGID